MNMQSLVIEQLAGEHRIELYRSSVASRPIARTSDAPGRKSLNARFAGWIKTVMLPVSRLAVVDR